MLRGRGYFSVSGLWRHGGASCFLTLYTARKQEAAVLVSRGITNRAAQAKVVRGARRCPAVVLSHPQAGLMSFLLSDPYIRLGSRKILCGGRYYCQQTSDLAWSVIFYQSISQFWFG